MQNSISVVSDLFARQQYQHIIDYLKNDSSIVIEQSPELMNMLAIALFKTGNCPAAMELMQTTLEKYPGQPVLIANYGNMLYENGDVQEAITQYQNAIRQQPDYGTAHINLANALLASGNAETALQHYQKAAELGNNTSSLFLSLARCHLALKNYPQSQQYLQQVLSAEPDNIDALNFSGELLTDCKQIPQAIQNYCHAIAIGKGNLQTFNNLGNLYRDERQFDDAIKTLHTACEYGRSRPEPYSNLGLCYSEIGAFDQAIEYFSAAIEKDATYLKAYIGLGIAYRRNAQWEKALDCFQQARQLAATNAAANYNAGALYLQVGDWEEGWKLYEWRKFLPEYATIHCNEVITEKLEIADQEIHVYAEQGFGDTLQFSRYLLLLRERGAAVHFGCQPVLASLLQQCLSDNDQLIDQRQLNPGCSLSLPLASLPLVLGETAPRSYKNGYLHCQNATLLADWRKRLGSTSNRMKIGLVWGGNPEYSTDWLRSPGLENFCCLLDLEADFYSLQCGPAAAQLNDEMKSRYSIDDLQQELHDFEQTAAAMECLDLMISSDTATLHLAGALGIPCWGILYADADWRWEKPHVTTSLWYPQMRLYRQNTWSQWEECLLRVRKDLTAFLQQQ